MIAELGLAFMYFQMSMYVHTRNFWLRKKLFLVLMNVNINNLFSIKISSQKLKIKDCTQTTESRGKQWPLTADSQ
jgi:hypothetical protein